MSSLRSFRLLAAAVAAAYCPLAAGAARPGPTPPSPTSALPSYLYGSNLVRARAIVKTGPVLHDYRVDRGKIKAVSGGTVTLKEKDGVTATILVGVTAKVQVNGRIAGFYALKRAMSAIVVRDGDEPAELVQASSRTLPTAWLATSYFGPSMVRLEALVKPSGTEHDYRLDRGRIRAITAGSVILRERDGLLVPVDISPAATIKLNGRPAPFSAIRRGMSVATIRDGDAPAGTLLAYTQ